MKNKKIILPKRKESEIKKSIINWLNIQPLTFAWMNYTTGIPDGKCGFRKNYNKGMPDIIGIKKGKVFAMEVKRKGCKPTYLQRICLEKIDSVGGYSCVVRSIEDVQEAFVEI